MMGFIGMVNNPMVGATVQVAVAIEMANVKVNVADAVGMAK